MQVILHEILKILAGTEQETAAQAFYEYFAKSIVYQRFRKFQ